MYIYAFCINAINCAHGLQSLQLYGLWLQVHPSDVVILPEETCISEPHLIELTFCK